MYMDFDKGKIPFLAGEAAIAIVMYILGIISIVNKSWFIVPVISFTVAILATVFFLKILRQ